MGHVLVWSLAFLLWNTLLCEQATDCEADIAFLLDGSGSISVEDFEKMKTFVQNLVSAFVGTNARFAIAQFSYKDRFTIHYYFNNFQSRESWESQITSISQLTGGTYTANAIRRVVDEIFVASRGSRNNVKKVLIVVTDGESHDSMDLRDAALSAEAKQIIRIAIGVGQTFDSPSAKAELITIGSLPSSDHVFKVDNFDSLDQIRITLLDKILCIKAVTTENTSPSPVLLNTGLVFGILLMILLPLLVLGWYKTSKGLCRNRFMESHGSNQGPSTAQTINQDENQLQVYSSLLHGDLCVYESIHASRNTADGEEQNEYECVLSPHHGDAENEDYYNVKPHN